MNDKLILLILSIVVIIVILLRYPKPNGCVKSGPGTCELDSDCGHGKCFKNDKDICMCICDDGYSGLNCQTKGIPWNSPQCMGPNKWNPRKDSKGMCVCPIGNWVSGNASGYGYVQCLKCGNDWGPFSGNSPCTGKWDTSTYLSKNCHGIDSPHSCDDFNYVLSQTGPNGVKGSTSMVKPCIRKGKNSCRCDPNNTSDDPPFRSLCSVTGWLNPEIPNDDCSKVSIERKCSSYKCYFD